MRFSSVLPLASPLPTAAPSAELIQHQLELRQQAPDTCGWFNGDPSNPATCNLGYTCAINTFDGAQGCCEDVNLCAIPTACVDYTALAASCGSLCQDDIFTLKCANTLYPYCFTNTYTSPMTLYALGCDESPFADGFVRPTVTGGDGSFTSVNPITEVATNITASGSAASSLFEPASGAGTAISSRSATGSGGGSIGPVQSTSGSGSGSSSDSQSQSLSPGIIAAIAVPSAVGAIGAIAALVFLILCIRRRKRRDRTIQAAVSGPYTQGPGANNNNNSPYLDTGGVNKEFQSPYSSPVHPGHMSSPSQPSMTMSSPSSPYLSPPAGGSDTYSYNREPGLYGLSPQSPSSGVLSRQNVDALSSQQSARTSDEIARGRRLSNDGMTAVPQPSMAGRTNFTADSFSPGGGMRY